MSIESINRKLETMDDQINSILENPDICIGCRVRLVREYLDESTKSLTHMSISEKESFKNDVLNIIRKEFNYYEDECTE